MKEASFGRRRPRLLPILSQNTHIHTSLTFTVYPILAFSSSHVIVHFVVVVVFIQVYWNAKFCSYFFLF